MGIKNCNYSIFIRLQKEQQIERTNKNSIKTCEKTLPETKSQISPLKNCSIKHSKANNVDVVYDLSFVRIGNK